MEIKKIMTFNDRKKEYIDKEIFKILDLFEETKEMVDKQNIKGSSAHQMPLDLSDKFVDSPYITRSVILELNQTTAIKECYKGKCVGLNEANYKKFQNFIDTLYKERSVCNKVSKNFIENKSIEWLLRTHKTKKVDVNFSGFLIDTIQESIEEVKVHYPLLHLDIGKPFYIGKVKFEYFTKEYFDELIAQFKLKNVDAKENPFEQMREKYQGRVYATYTLKAELEKAQEIAFEECCLAVDILKMCSETTDIPNLKLSFDIDSRVKEKTTSENIVMNPSKVIETFSIHLNRIPNQHKIHENEWNRILGRQLNDFHNFLLTLSEAPSELERLIINGIKRYGNAISNPNMHQRIVELFTILESLLLTSKNSPIIETVCKYCSKLIFKKVKDRKELITLLKSMYELRSDLVHHAKESPFEIDNLRKLQYCVIMLLSTLIKKMQEHKTKNSLLGEIDDAILAAY